MSFYDTIVIASVGILTVFIILSLVWLLGVLLILFTNKLSIPKKTTNPISSRSNQDVNFISKNQWVAIASTVNIVTQGTGKITEIKRKN